MGCFKAVLDKLKKDVQQKMGNMPALKVHDDRFERMSEERISKKSYSDFLLPDWMEETRVPMDFTEGTGRIVVDEAELAQIRRNPREWARDEDERFELYDTGPTDILKQGRHMTQQYYHGDLNRVAAEVLLANENIEGSWLLRSSRMRKHCLTLSYMHDARVHNKYVFAAPHQDRSSGKHIYVITLDKKLAFYDVHSLTEFYRLNYSDALKCMLTQSIKNGNQRDCSPPRPIAPRVVPAAGSIDETVAVSADKSPRSLRSFLSKSFQALKPKKLAVGGSPQELSAPSTSKEQGGTVEPPPKQPEPLASPPSSLQEPTSSGISSIEEPSPPTSPPSLMQEEAPVPAPPASEPQAPAPPASEPQAPAPLASEPQAPAKAPEA